jgi:oxygen-independent coproporphyrinogen-3 oxidase
MDNPWGMLAGVRPSKPLHQLLDQGMGFNDAFLSMRQRYRISRDKFTLLWRVAELERPVLAGSMDPRLFSIYVGIPFCPSRCIYCSFPSHSLRELGMLQGAFVEALLFEIEDAGNLTRNMGMRPYSVYVGGGTPTSLSPGDLDRVLHVLHDSFPGNWREFTVEAGRPDTISIEQLDVLKKWRVNRISINPQTMHARTLQLIGREHTPQDVGVAMKEARKAGFSAINMDLIIGLPGENTPMVAETTCQIIAFKPENVTLHMFSPKRASSYSQNRERFTLPSADEAAEMHTKAAGLLEALYQPYYLYRQREILGGLENIGYTLPGHTCVYNVVMIEERHHILGVGTGATSKYIYPDFKLLNFSSPKDVRIYIQRVKQLAESRREKLSRAMEKK